MAAYSKLGFRFTPSASSLPFNVGKDRELNYEGTLSAEIDGEPKCRRKDGVAGKIGWPKIQIREILHGVRTWHFILHLLHCYT